MANRARKANVLNHRKQLKTNRAKAKYNRGMMLVNANADKLRETYNDISNNEGEEN